MPKTQTDSTAKASPTKARPKPAQKSEAARSGSQVQSLTRALSLLENLSQQNRGCSLTELAKLSGLATSTTHRLLTTLEHKRFVRFDRSNNLWSIGVTSFTVGNAFARSRNFPVLARSYMRHLMERVGETVNLAILDQDMIVYLAQVECREMMRAFARPGTRVLATRSAVGKSLLAAMPDDDINRLMFSDDLPANPDRQNLTQQQLTTLLDRVRRDGYAIDDQEQSVGLRCVASVIYDENNWPLAAISISGPTARISQDRIPVLGKMVRETCRDITAEVGGLYPE